MFYRIKRLLTRTPAISDVKGLRAAHFNLSSGYEQLNIKGRLEVAISEKRVGGLVGRSREGFLVGSLFYEKPVDIETAYADLEKIRRRTTQQGHPERVVDFLSPKHTVKTVQFADLNFPNPVDLQEDASVYSELNRRPFEKGQPLDRKLAYSIRFRLPAYLPPNGLDGLHDALKNKRGQRPENIPNGFEWFQSIVKKAIVTLSYRDLKVDGYPVKFMDVCIEGFVRECANYDLFVEIMEYDKELKKWLQGNTSEGDYRNPVARFLQNPDNRDFRVYLEKNRREELEKKAEETGTKSPDLPNISEFLDMGQDIVKMNAALGSTSPGRQKRLLLPYIMIDKGIIFKEENPEIPPKNGEPSRIIVPYRLSNYNGKLMTEKDVREVFTSK